MYLDSYLLFNSDIQFTISCFLRNNNPRNNLFHNPQRLLFHATLSTTAASTRRRSPINPLFCLLEVSLSLLLSHLRVRALPSISFDRQYSSLYLSSRPRYLSQYRPSQFSREILLVIKLCWSSSSYNESYRKFFSSGFRCIKISNRNNFILIGININYFVNFFLYFHVTNMNLPNPSSINLTFRSLIFLIK